MAESRNSGGSGPEGDSHRAFFEHVPMGIYRTTPNGEFLDANPTLAVMLGFPDRDALMKVNAATLYVDLADRARWRAIMDEHGIVDEFEVQKRRRDGSSLWLRDSARAIRSDDGEVLYYEGACVDVTARRLAEQALRASERRARALLEAFPDTILRLDDELRCTAAKSADDILPSSDACIGGTLEDLLPPLLAHKVREALARDAGESVESEELEVEVGDVVRDYELRVRGGGRDEGLVLLRDISESKRLRKQLLLSDRMASVGQLAAGVAHEINNPLSYVLTNVDWVRELLASFPTEPAQTDLEVFQSLRQEAITALQEAQMGVERVHKIIFDLKRFSRPAADDVPRPIEVHTVVESSLNIVRNEIRHRAQLVQRLDDVPPVAAEPSKLSQVLVNLLVNAAQAIPEGETQANEITVATSTAATGDAVIEVSDTGVGISAADRARIFDPFFTTKPVGVGTGLGLSICHSLVKSLGGTIEVESSHDRGTTFRIVLPRAEAAISRPDEATAERPLSRRARVLVIDDEPVIGGALARALDHDVVAVTRGADALARIEAGEQFNLVLCDLMMPEMTGMQLYAHLREHDPGLAERTIFITGGAFTPAAEDFLSRVDNLCLQKPVTLQVLRREIEQALAGWE